MILPGAEPWSHSSAESGAGGALVLHGFTGNPSSVRPLAEALAGGGMHVELPRLPGHGTTIEEMLTTRWADWFGEAQAAYTRLTERADRVVIAGLSMGGTLSLALALAHPGIAGLVCVNPLTQPPPDEVRALLADTVAGGTAVMPGIGSDIADPDAAESAYAGSPVEGLLSLLDDGVAPITARYGELTTPLLLFTSKEDHVVEPANSEHLAATYGGPVDHRWLERSYHVATLDFDRDVIAVEAVAFARRVTGS